MMMVLNQFIDLFVLLLFVATCTFHHAIKVNSLQAASSSLSIRMVQSSYSQDWPDLKQPLKGIIPPLITPLLDQNTIDQDSTKHIIEHVINGGVSGIFILGTTGEASSLSRQLKLDFIHLCCEAVQERVPVLVGITDTSLTETLHLASVSKDAGATAVVLTAPYYFPLDQNELLQYVKNVLDDIELPLMLYNMPGLTKIWFEVDTVCKLLKETKIVGIKDSSGDLNYFGKICKLVKEVRPDWTILIGPEHLTTQAIALGADGGVNGGANIEPELFVQMCQASLEKNESRVTELMKRVIAIQDIYKVGMVTGGYRFVTATKCAMSLRGLCSDFMASPLLAFHKEDCENVRKILQELPKVDLKSTSTK